MPRSSIRALGQGLQSQSYDQRFALAMDGEFSRRTGLLQQVLDLPKGVLICRFTINCSDDVTFLQSTLVCRRALDHSMHDHPFKLRSVCFEHQSTGVGRKRIVKMAVRLQDDTTARVIDDYFETAKDIAPQIYPNIFHGERTIGVG